MPDKPVVLKAVKAGAATVLLTGQLTTGLIYCKKTVEANAEAEALAAATPLPAH